MSSTHSRFLRSGTIPCRTVHARSGDHSRAAGPRCTIDTPTRASLVPNLRFTSRARSANPSANDAWPFADRPRRPCWAGRRIRPVRPRRAARHPQRRRPPSPAPPYRNRSPCRPAPGGVTTYRSRISGIGATPGPPSRTHVTMSSVASGSLTSPEPHRTRSAGASLGRRLHHDDVRLLAHVQTFRDAHGNRGPQPCRLRRVVTGHLHRAAATVGTPPPGSEPLPARPRPASRLRSVFLSCPTPLTGRSAPVPVEEATA